MSDLYFHIVIQLVIVSLCAGVGDSQGMAPKKKRYPAVNEEIPHISCHVCEQVIKEIDFTVAKLRANNQKVSEDEILSNVEKACTMKAEQGKWIKRFDIQQSDSKLKLIDNGDPGKCKSECATIGKACENIIGEIDTELGELLWQNKFSQDELITKSCHEMTSSCEKVKKPLKKDRKDEIFSILSEEEMKAEELMEQMGGMPGMPGMEMFSRDDIEAMTDPGGEPQSEDQASNNDQEDVPMQPRSSEVTFIELVKGSATKTWNWIKSTLGYKIKKTEF